MNAIDFKKRQHDVHANALVSVHKGVVGDQRIAKASALFLLARILFLSIKGRISAFQRAFQKAKIAHVRSASGLRDQKLVEQEYFIS